MPLTDRIPEERKNSIKNILTEIRDRAVDLQEQTSEIEGLIGMFLEGLASRIIKLMDIALGEL